MKINWFSPILPQKTGIAKYTYDLLEPLSKEAEITLCIDQEYWPKEIENYVKIMPFSQKTIRKINETDINIYHLGNNTQFHSYIWETCLRYPGIIVLHDINLHHFFAGYYLVLKNNPEQYQFILSKKYGPKAANIVKLFQQDQITFEELNAIFPITFHAAENSIGLIVHTHEAFNCMKDLDNIPVTRMNLPYVYSNNKKSFILKEKYKLIIYGYLGLNRCLDIVLHTLASSFEFREKYSLDIYGEIENKEEILSLISHLNLKTQVKCHGFVDDHELDNALANSDLVINMRNPTMGEVSYSQLGIWNHALPTIVTQSGWYASLPENTVFFVRPEYEIPDLTMHLTHYLQNPEIFIKKGLNGQAYLKQYHSAERYIQSILNFIPYAIKFRNFKKISNLASNIHPLLLDWPNEVKQEIAKKIYGLCE